MPHLIPHLLARRLSCQGPLLMYGERPPVPAERPAIPQNLVPPGGVLSTPYLAQQRPQDQAQDAAHDGYNMIHDQAPAAVMLTEVAVFTGIELAKLRLPSCGATPAEMRDDTVRCVVNVPARMMEPMTE